MVGALCNCTNECRSVASDQLLRLRVRNVLAEEIVLLLFDDITAGISPSAI